ncbi:MAG TPA: hypothetical protein VGC21_10605 [Telluria sp.]|jgi:cytochrome c-type biogenesis protein CcmH
MIVFLLAAGTLLVFALSILVPPLWRGNGTRPLGLGVGTGLLAGAVLLYAGLGTPAGLSAKPADPALVSARDAQAMVNRLASHMKSDPDNASGWLLLARGQALLRHYAESAAAYSRVVELGKDDPGLLADYAEVLAQAQGDSLRGKPADLLARALLVDPRHPRALYLSGGAYFERGEFQKAIDAWTLLAAVAPESEELHALAVANIAQARGRQTAAAN